MSNRVDVLEAEAMKLSREERARLTDCLFASLSDDAETGAARTVEVEIRIAEREAGPAPLVPVADAIARAREAAQ